MTSTIPCECERIGRRLVELQKLYDFLDEKSLSSCCTEQWTAEREARLVDDEIRALQHIASHEAPHTFEGAILKLLLIGNTADEIDHSITDKRELSVAVASILSSLQHVIQFIEQETGAKSSLVGGDIYRSTKQSLTTQEICQSYAQIA